MTKRLLDASISAAEAAEILDAAAARIEAEAAEVEAEGDYDKVALMRSSGDLEVMVALRLGADSLRDHDHDDG